MVAAEESSRDSYYVLNRSEYRDFVSRSNLLRSDLGYCPTCSRKWFCSEDGDCDGSSWAPLCRICRQELTLASEPAATDHYLFRCPSHHDERCVLIHGNARWTCLAPR